MSEPEETTTVATVEPETKTLAAAWGSAEGRALVQQTGASGTRAVSQSLADIARRIPDEEMRKKLMDVVNVLDETALALRDGDKREDWIRDEDTLVPKSFDALGRERVVQTLGLETRAGASATDWVDVNDALRMHSMLRSFAPHDEDGRPLEREALKGRVIEALDFGERVDPDKVDVPAILGEMREQILGMLESAKAKKLAAIEAGSVDGALAVAELSLLDAKKEEEAIQVTKALL